MWKEIPLKEGRNKMLYCKMLIRGGKKKNDYSIFKRFQSLAWPLTNKLKKNIPVLDSAEDDLTGPFLF